MNLYSDYLLGYFDNNVDEAMSAYSQLLGSRLKIMELLKQYKSDYGVLHLKEKYNSVYVNKEVFEDGDEYVVLCGNGLNDIADKLNNIELENKTELDFIELTDLFNFGKIVEFLNQIDVSKIDRIKISNFDRIYTDLMDLERNKKYEFIDILKNNDIDANVDNFQYIWLDKLIKIFVEKIMFSIEINDYIFYQDDPVYELMFGDIVKLLNDGFLDEIVLKLNYFTWDDVFDKIVDKMKEIDYGQLINIKFDGLMPLKKYYKYPNSNEVVTFSDFEHFMSNVIFELYDKLKLNFKQFYGFEIDGGYIGYDVYEKINVNDEFSFEKLKEAVCANKEIIKQYYEKVEIILNDKSFLCVADF